MAWLLRVSVTPMAVNKAIILGNLGSDPELRSTPSGAQVCNFNVATNESWKDKDGEKHDRTEWHKIIVWGKVAENCQKYLSKGRQVYIEGRIQTRSWEDKEGVKRYTTEIVASKVDFIGGGNGGGGDRPPPPGDSDTPPQDMDADIPF